MSWTLPGLLARSYVRNLREILELCQTLDEATLRRHLPGTNTIAHDLWHTARWADHLQSIISEMAPSLNRRLGTQPEIWIAEELKSRWGMVGLDLGYSLLATLSPPDRRHRATAVSRVATNAGFGLGGAIGGVVAALGLPGFVGLFLFNAATYLIYVCILAALVRKSPRPAPIAGGYRLVLGDRAFVRLAVANVAMIAVGWGVFSWLIPAYARNGLGAGVHLIGLLFLANAFTVGVAQLPIARLAEGHRRVLMMAVAGVMFALACVLVLVASRNPGTTSALLVPSAVLVGVGECFHTTALMPLVADLARPAVRGRYMAAMGFSWWIGLTIAPTVGGELLSVSPAVLLIGSAVAALMAAAAILALERHLPAPARLTPRPI